MKVRKLGTWFVNLGANVTHDIVLWCIKSVPDAWIWWKSAREMRSRPPLPMPPLKDGNIGAPFSSKESNCVYVCAYFLLALCNWIKRIICDTLGLPTSRAQNFFFGSEENSLPEPEMKSEGLLRKSSDMLLPVKAEMTCVPFLFFCLFHSQSGANQQPSFCWHTQSPFKRGQTPTADPLRCPSLSAVRRSN